MTNGQQLALFDSEGCSVAVGDAPRVLVDPETGERITLQTVNKSYYNGRHFWKIFLMDFLAVLGIIESKQLNVVVYVMEHTSPYNNQFIGSNRAVAAELGVSVDTVSKTFKKLQTSKFIRKTSTPGVYLVNPSIMVQGSDAKQRGLLINYRESRTPDTYADAQESGCADSGVPTMLDAEVDGGTSVGQEPAS